MGLMGRMGNLGLMGRMGIMGELGTGDRSNHAFFEALWGIF